MFEKLFSRDGQQSRAAESFVSTELHFFECCNDAKKSCHSDLELSLYLNMMIQKTNSWYFMKSNA